MKLLENTILQKRALLKKNDISVIICDSLFLYYSITDICAAPCLSIRNGDAHKYAGYVVVAQVVISAFEL